MAKIRWTSEEVDLLIRNFNRMTLDELEALFPYRNKKAIQRKIEKLQFSGDLNYKYSSKRSVKPKDDGWSDRWD